MVTYLSFAQVVKVHHRMMQEIEGERQWCLHPGIYENLLAGCVEKPQIIVGEWEPYPDIFSKAAALLECIISSNAFVDGSKRTGFLACELFLELNGYRIDPGAAIVELLLAVAMGTLSVDEISNRLREHSVKIK
jgi:death-on-curing protein